MDEEFGADGKVRDGAERPAQVRPDAVCPLERIDVGVGLCAGVVGLEAMPTNVYEHFPI